MNFSCHSVQDSALLSIHRCQLSRGTWIFQKQMRRNGGLTVFLEQVFAREVKEANKISAMEGIKKVCIAFDLQTALETRHGENGEFYYKRNFSTYNLTLSVLTSQDTLLCVGPNCGW